jgi:hypothetical protein
VQELEAGDRESAELEAKLTSLRQTITRQDGRTPRHWTCAMLTLDLPQR